MAIGDTVQAGLGRMDFSAFQKAGAAQAQANQAFGQAIEKAAIGFFQGQEKKKKKQEMVQGLTMLFPDAPPELVNAMAKNPEVTQAKQNLDRFNLEVKKFNKDAEVSDQQVAMMNQAMQKTQADRLQAEQNRKDTENFYNFMGDPTYQVDQDGIPSPFPGPSLAEQLVVSEEAKAFIRRAIEQGQPIDKAITMGQQIDQQIEGNQPKPMSLKEEADLRAVNLSNQKKALELKQKTNPEPTTNLAYTESTLNAISDAENILNNSKLPVTGFWGNALKDIPGTPSADLKNSIKTIYSAIGFDKLQDMRDRSPTGGALGQVSERELSQLNASLGSLEQSQSAEQFKKNLMRVKDHYQKYYKATMAQVKAYQQGLKFDTTEEAISWMDQNVPMASKPTPDNQTNITTPGGFVLSDN